MSLDKFYDAVVLYALISAAPKRLEPESLIGFIDYADHIRPEAGEIREVMDRLVQAGHATVQDGRYAGSAQAAAACQPRVAGIPGLQDAIRVVEAYLAGRLT